MKRGVQAILAGIALSCVPSVQAVEGESKPTPPPASIEGLNSENFRVREEAQKELLKWSREHRDAAVDSLVKLTSGDGDPETSSRCLQILRELAMDDFDCEGEGYIGINMLDVMVPVPGDPQPRAGIRIGQVVDDSAAKDAGLLMGDVIVGMGDGALGYEVWRELPLSEKFGREIRAHKPRSKVDFKILRGEKLMDISVVLRRRPPIPNSLFLLEETDLDFEALEKAEKDAYFRNWLKEKTFKK